MTISYLTVTTPPEKLRLNVQKTKKLNPTEDTMKRAITLLLLGFLTLASLLAAQEKSFKKFGEKEVANLAAGILSENYGLQRSSIYFAGYYKVADVANEITKVMLTSDQPNIKILAALALYEIGDEEALDNFAYLVNNEQENLKVRRLAKAIYDKWDEELQLGMVVAAH